MNEFSVSIERMYDRSLLQNALAAHGVGARTGARPNRPPDSADIDICDKQCGMRYDYSLFPKPF